jgi:hypothetical protein
MSEESEHLHGDQRFVEVPYSPEPARSALDPLVVNTEQLARVLRAFIDTHNSQHEYTATGYRENFIEQMTGIAYLAEWSGISKGYINRVLRCANAFTNLRMADRLLTAAGMAHLLDDEIEVFPNPWLGPEYFSDYMKRRGCY